MEWNDPALRFEPPQELLERIAAIPRRRTRRRSILPWALAAGFLLAAGLAVERTRGIRADALGAELVGNQIRSLQPGRLAEVASSDRHTVKPWFAGKLDFSPPVKDLASEGFPLLGGRVDALWGRPVAALAYGRDRHVINLYIAPRGAIPEGAPEERSGFRIRRWTEAGMAFWAVSDLEASELSRFEALLR
jgi:anti-sigma factor RsiW